VKAGVKKGKPPKLEPEGECVVKEKKKEIIKEGNRNAKKKKREQTGLENCRQREKKVWGGGRLPQVPNLSTKEMRKVRDRRGKGGRDKKTRVPIFGKAWDKRDGGLPTRASDSVQTSKSFAIWVNEQLWKVHQDFQKKTPLKKGVDHVNSREANGL